MAGHTEVQASTPPYNSSGKGMNITIGEAHRTEEKQSRKIVREAKQVLAYQDSTFSDQFNAMRVLTFVTLEHPRSSRLAWYISIFLVGCILLNSLAFISSTVPSVLRYPTSCANPICTPGPDTVCPEVVCRPLENRTTWMLELITIIIFTIDYVLRVFCVPPVPVDLVFPRSLEYTIDGRLKDRSRYYRMSTCQKVTKYVTSGLNIIDVVSIVPYYISLFAGGSYTFLRIFRFLRFLLIFKLGRRFREAGAIISRTLRASLPALLIFVFLTTVMAVTFGSIMYYFEGGVYSVTLEFPSGGFLRPNARNTALEQSPFTSIIMGIYWYIVNTTTLGNAALFPTTTGGRIASCFIAYFGLLSLALPITIIGQNFSQQYNLVYADPDSQPHLFYPPTPRTPRTPRRKGGAPGSADGFLGHSIVGGGKEDLSYVSPEQEIEALRAEFQQQVDGLRMHMQQQGSKAASSAPSQQEVDSLKAYVQREISSMRTAMNGATDRGQFQQQPQQPQQQHQQQQQQQQQGFREGGYERMSSEDVDTRSFPMPVGRETVRENVYREQGRETNFRDRESAEALRQRQREEEEERENQTQRSLREAEINSFRNQITEGIGRFSPQAELETFRGGLY